MNYTMLNLYLIACLVFLLILMWVQHNRRTVMLFSTRNMFLVGFAYFQIISVMYWVSEPELFGELWPLTRPKQDASQFIAMSFLFLLFYLIAYQLFRFVSKHYQRFTFMSGAEGDSFLLLMALIMSVMSVGMQLGGLFNRYIGILAQYAGISMGAAACGLTAWVLVARYKNPIIVGYATGIIAINMFGQLGGFSRRGLLSMGLAILWAMFYRYFHIKRTGKLAIIFAAIFLPSFLVVSGFTAIRQYEGMSNQEAVSLLSVDALKVGARRLVGPTDTGPISLWLIENYPENFRYRHMFTPMYTFGHFVPRAWWKNKPTTLSYLAVKQGRLKNVGSLNVGPGIIGHAAAEGGYYAIVVYAILLAVLTKFIDEIARYNNVNVYVVVPIGAALAEIFASARGETSYMLGVGATGVVCVFLFMMATAKLTGSRLPSQAFAYQR